MTTTPPPGHGPIDWDAEEEAAEQDRPGAPRTRRRWWIVGGGAVVVMVAMAIIWGLSATVGRVHWTDTGHQILSDTEVQVRFDLQRNPSREVVCRLEAQDLGHQVVGRTEVTVSTGEESRSRHLGTVGTAAPAVTGYVDQCWYADEGPRR